MFNNIFESFTNNNIFKNKIYKNFALAEKSLSATSSDIERHRPPKELLRQFIGKTKKYPEDIGTHPDFM